MSSVDRLVIASSAICALVLVGCAKGSTETLDTGRITFVDGGVRIDGGFDGGGFDGGVDGGGVDGGTTPIDVGVDAPVVAPDVPACTPRTTQLLANPTFDASPLGAGWDQTVADPTQPPIGSYTLWTPWQSGSSGAALGGLSDAFESVEQLVTVPAGTTLLTLRGYYTIDTDEFGSTPYDVSGVYLASSTGTLYETGVELSNADATPSWTPFTHVFANPHAGEMVLLAIQSQTDGSYSTLFAYDSLSLEATVSCP